MVIHLILAFLNVLGYSRLLEVGSRVYEGVEVNFVKTNAGWGGLRIYVILYGLILNINFLQVITVIEHYLLR